MQLERLPVESCGEPFPVHAGLVARLLAAHAPRAATGAAPDDPRDPTVAHVLATCAGYAYADTATVATMMARLGVDGGACVGVTQVVDAMLVFSTAYLVQSRCGRVVVLCYRGTQATNLANWLGDADIGPETLTLGGAPLQVHAGFHRNLRATRFSVLEELTRALDGRSLLDPSRRTEQPLEALYVTGHSLGGAMAALFALSLTANDQHRALAERLRAVYTFGQPMALVEPIPDRAREVARALFRHVLPRDVVPALPPVQWGRFAHVGREYRHAEGHWHGAETPVAQLRRLRDIPHSVLTLVAPARRRSSTRYALGEHLPHLYIDALRPPECITELGDRAAGHRHKS